MKFFLMFAALSEAFKPKDEFLKIVNTKQLQLEPRGRTRSYNLTPWFQKSGAGIEKWVEISICTEV